MALSPRTSTTGPPVVGIFLMWNTLLSKEEKYSHCSPADQHAQTPLTPRSRASLPSPRTSQSVTSGVFELRLLRKFTQRPRGDHTGTPTTTRGSNSRVSGRIDPSVIRAVQTFA